MSSLGCKNHNLTILRFSNFCHFNIGEWRAKTYTMGGKVWVLLNLVDLWLAYESKLTPNAQLSILFGFVQFDVTKRLSWRIDSF